MVRIGGHVVERSLLAAEGTSVLELSHKSNVLHHGSVVWVGCAAKTATPLSAVAVVLWVMLLYLVTVGMMWQRPMHCAIYGHRH